MCPSRGPANTGPCSIEDCEEDAHARGWCMLHYSRWRRTGTTNAPEPREPAPDTCTIDDCNNPYYARGYCSTHYTRVNRHGDPHITGKKGGPRGKRNPNQRENLDTLPSHLAYFLRARRQRETRNHRATTRDKTAA